MTDHRAQLTAPGIVGQVLGSYRITGELGRGGMGTIYRARHELIGRPAAVKVLRAELTANDELVQRFFNEAKAATAVDHPGIVEVFDFGYTDDGRAYLIMEFLDGPSLAQRLERRRSLSELEAAQIARGIASALTAAHGKGIVHRDLKPDNVMLAPDPDVPGGERPKVLDFGIAKLADPTGLPADHRQTATGTLMGTPLYMAPEQARAAGAIDHRADLYSLGCMLYEMLVGEPPFVAVGAGEIIALQLFGTAQPPSARGAAVSPELDRIVMRLLDKEPAARLQSAGELVDALDAVLGRPGAGHTALAGAGPRPPLLVTRSGERPVRRVRPYAIALAVLALAALATAILIVATQRDAPPVAATAAAPPPVQVEPARPVVVVPAPQPAPPPPVPARPQPSHAAPKSSRCPHSNGPVTANCTPYVDKL
ncbi:MAG TPA: serine/threonine-protein kinase [Kofleriaceae bacterium]|nr:serine/threonine-protein kinase [Kofleriaceae bacterium]